MVERALAPLIGSLNVLSRAAVFDDLPGPVRPPSKHASLVNGVERINKHLGACDWQPHCNRPFAEAAQEVEFWRASKARLYRPSTRIGSLVAGPTHHARPFTRLHVNAQTTGLPRATLTTGY